MCANGKRATGIVEEMINRAKVTRDRGKSGDAVDDHGVSRDYEQTKRNFEKTVSRATNSELTTTC